jgi:protein gp37
MATRHRNASARGGKWTGEIVTFPERLAKPLRWRKPRVIAVQYMGDLFYERVPFEVIAATFGVMAACPQHRFLVLTKRPERMRKFLDWIRVHRGTGIPFGGLNSGFEIEEVRLGESPADRATWNAVSFAEPLLGHRLDFRADKTDPNSKALQWPLPNVWLGVSAEDQQTLEARWAHLRQCPAVKRWVSLEPLLGSVDLTQALLRFCGCGMQTDACDDWKSGVGCRLEPPRADWVVVGGESGHRARPCDIAWIGDIVHKCQAAGVPVHVKQLEVRGKLLHRARDGTWPELWPTWLRRREFPEVIPVEKRRA